MDLRRLFAHVFKLKSPYLSMKKLAKNWKYISIVSTKHIFCNFLNCHQLYKFYLIFIKSCLLCIFSFVYWKNWIIIINLIKVLMIHFLKIHFLKRNVFLCIRIWLLWISWTNRVLGYFLHLKKHLIKLFSAIFQFDYSSTS